MDDKFLHQEQAIEFLLNNRRAILGDEPGLGKTRVLLEAAKERMGRRGVLVVCLTSLIPNWWNEVEKWGFPKNKITIVGYEHSFLHQFDDLMKQRWGVLIADEADSMRRWEAQKTQRFADLIKGRDSCVWLATGTPVRNGAHDMHPLLSFIQPGKWGKYGDFCEKFCKQKPDKWSKMVNAEGDPVKYYDMKNAKVLSAAIKQVMIRRYKKDVVKDLPDKIVSNIPIELPGNSSFDIFTDQGIIQEVLRGVEQQGAATLSKEALDTMQAIGLAKVDQVYKFAKDTLGNVPLVLFGHHRAVLNAYVEKFADEGRNVSLIIGGMSQQDKAWKVKDFQEGRLDVLVVSIMAGGVGINLFRASHCILAEFPWTQAAIDQAIDRLHRIGQKSCVNAYCIYARETLEEPMLEAIRKKKHVMKELVGYAG